MKPTGHLKLFIRTAQKFYNDSHKKNFQSASFWDLCLRHSSGAVHRHDLAEPVGAVHRALLPEIQEQLQERRLSFKISWTPVLTVGDVTTLILKFSRVCRVTLDTGSSDKHNWWVTRVMAVASVILTHKMCFLYCFYLSIKPMYSFL